MVKKITISKRDREKLKEQKRKEKQQRKEERQSNGPSSFEDMIAYVDQFGVLHSVPQERLEEEVDASHIEVSVPKQKDWKRRHRVYDTSWRRNLTGIR